MDADPFFQTTVKIFFSSLFVTNIINNPNHVTVWRLPHLLRAFGLLLPVPWQTLEADARLRWTGTGLLPAGSDRARFVCHPRQCADHKVQVDRVACYPRCISTIQFARRYGA